MKKGGKKGFKKKDGTYTLKDLSKVMCFQCHEMEHYAGQFLLKKGKGVE